MKEGMGRRGRARKSHCLRLEGWTITRDQENPSFKIFHVLESEAGSAWVGGEGAPAEAQNVSGEASWPS